MITKLIIGIVAFFFVFQPLNIPIFELMSELPLTKHLFTISLLNYYPK